MNKSCVAAYLGGWPDGRGLSGRMRVERVAGSPWNRWPDAHGMGGRMAVESADATFTSLIPLLSVALMWLLGWLGVPSPYGTYAGYGLGIIMAIVVIRATYLANGLSLWFVMALITKTTMISLFYLLMIALMAGNSARKPGESRRAFESRSRRESRERTAAMIAITAIFTWLSAWLCRDRYFSPLGDYLAGRNQQQG